MICICFTNPGNRLITPLESQVDLAQSAWVWVTTGLRRCPASSGTGAHAAF